LAELVGGIDHTAAGAAVSRFDDRLRERLALGEPMHQIEVQLSNVEM
jgi:hypothetical protein